MNPGMTFRRCSMIREGTTRLKSKATSMHHGPIVGDSLSNARRLACGNKLGGPIGAGPPLTPSLPGWAAGLHYSRLAAGISSCFPAGRHTQGGFFFAVHSRRCPAGDLALVE